MIHGEPARAVGRTLVLTLLQLAVLVAPATAGQPPLPTGGEGSLRPITAGIANGERTTLPPSVAWLLFPDGECTATLIGCRTLLSAAHCFCADDENGSNCQPSTDAVAFLQHAGLFAVDSVSVHPDYEFAEASDLAVVHLGRQVEGIEPAAINTVGKPAPGAVGRLVGFGLASDSDDASGGIKRQGLVGLVSCSQGIPGATHLCWEFAPPFGPPGEDSNTCAGDSGGPLFVDFAGASLLAGVTSGGTGECDVDDLAFDADVFRDRAWIQQQAGSDLGDACGGLAPAGGAGSPISSAAGTLSGGNPSDAYEIEIAAGTERLVVTLNGPLSDDFELAVDPPGPGGDCESINVGTVEECIFDSPTPGTWTLTADRFAGSGPYQLTATVFAAAGGGNGGPCTAGATTLCIDRQSGDRRFRLRMSYDSVLGGGVSGDATATPLTSLGISRGGIFAFTNPANPEVMVKVLDGCALTGHFWVFYAATTTLGFELTVEDTLGGATKTYTNPDQTAARTVTDTMALASCP